MKIMTEMMSLITNLKWGICLCVCLTVCERVELAVVKDWMF